MRDEAILSMSGSSGRQRVPNDFFNDYLIPYPTDDVVDKFEENIGPIMKEINNNAKEINYLKSIRDSLLPRLMSGKIRVGVA